MKARSRKTGPRLAGLALAILASMPAAGILTRADRDDGEYREFATRYAATVCLEGQGTGVLIAPRWVLTGAREAAALRDREARARIDFGDGAHDVQQFFLHPDWKPGGESDVALLFLREPVTGVAPARINRQGDETGRTVRIAGCGLTGRIGDPVARMRADGRMRASVNTVDRVTPLTLGTRLKDPEEASDLQGAVAPGDGGAPAFRDLDGQILVAGIASVDAAAGDRGRRAGDWETYARVSAFAGWIDDVMSRVAVEEAARATAVPAR